MLTPLEMAWPVQHSSPLKNGALSHDFEGSPVEKGERIWTCAEKSCRSTGSLLLQRIDLNSISGLEISQPGFVPQAFTRMHSST